MNSVREFSAPETIVSLFMPLCTSRSWLFDRNQDLLCCGCSDVYSFSFDFDSSEICC